MLTLLFTEIKIINLQLVLFFNSDRNECLLNICKNGRCEKTRDSFKCICDRGFDVDDKGTNCEGTIPNLCLLVLLIPIELYLYLYAKTTFNLFDLIPFQILMSVKSPMESAVLANASMFLALSAVIVTMGIGTRC